MLGAGSRLQFVVALKAMSASVSMSTASSVSVVLHALLLELVLNQVGSRVLLAVKGSLANLHIPVICIIHLGICVAQEGASGFGVRRGSTQVPFRGALFGPRQNGKTSMPAIGLSFGVYGVLRKAAQGPQEKVCFFWCGER